MFNKKISLAGVITIFFIGMVFIIHLYGNSASYNSFQIQHISDTQESVPINIIDSFKCGTMDIYDKMIKEDPDFERKQQDLETFTKNYIKDIKPRYKNIITIPVVIHIVYNNPGQNISNTVIQSQIDILNKDYRRLNDDTINTPAPFKSLGGDPQIEYMLAKRDPLGNPSIGITRTQTSVISFIPDNSVKFTSSGGIDIWDRDKYCNIWVCNLTGASGYAQFPGGAAATDGIVIGFSSFGKNNNKGRTGTHEIGHWINLRHIWGDAYCGDDFVDDTPVQETSNIGCPSFPHITCNNGPNGDMFTNYMDYTNGDCKNIFTLGQSVRMNACLNSVRSSLLASDGGIPVSGVPIAHFRTDKQIVNFGENINFLDESGGIPTGWQWIFEGGIPLTSNQKNPVIMYTNPGIYSVKLKVANSYGTDSVNYINYIKVLGANMMPFSVVHPSSNAFIHTYASDTTGITFTWTKSSTNPSISYKWKIRKFGTSNEATLISANNGEDSLVILRNRLLDSIAAGFGGNGDTIKCVWRVFAFNGIDSLSSQNQNIVNIIHHTVGIRVISSNIPVEFKLYLNYPNPFNPGTFINFQLPINNNVRLVIYDNTGRVIETLVDKYLQAGTYQVKWNGSNFSSGVYFYNLTAGKFTDVKKMILIK